MNAWWERKGPNCCPLPILLPKLPVASVDNVLGWSCLSCLSLAIELVCAWPYALHVVYRWDHKITKMQLKQNLLYYPQVEFMNIIFFFEEQWSTKKYTFLNKHSTWPKLWTFLTRVQNKNFVWHSVHMPVNKNTFTKKCRKIWGYRLRLSHNSPVAMACVV